MQIVQEIGPDRPRIVATEVWYPPCGASIRVDPTLSRSIVVWWLVIVVKEESETDMMFLVWKIINLGSKLLIVRCQVHAAYYYFASWVVSSRIMRQNLQGRLIEGGGVNVVVGIGVAQGIVKLNGYCAKVAGQHLVRRYRRAAARSFLALNRALVVAENKQFVSYDGAADGPPN